MSQYIIYGSGGHSRSVSEVILFNDPGAQLTFVDEAAQPDEKIFGFDLVADIDAPDGAQRFIAIGDNTKRKNKAESLGVELTQVIANDAYIGRDVKIGQGCLVGHDAYLGPLVELGDRSIVNTRALLEHEVKIGNDSQVAPGVIIAGRVVIGENVFVGVGATIIDNLTVCSDVVIGAAAVVTKDITEPGTYVGIPARRVDG